MDDDEGNRGMEPREDLGEYTSNYRELLFATEFVRYFNILIAAVGAIVLNVVAATLAGYGLTWFAFPGKETFAFGTLFSYIFPPILAVTARQRQSIEHVDDDGCDAGGPELGGSSRRASRTQHFITRVEQLRHISQPLRTCHFPIHIRWPLSILAKITIPRGRERPAGSLNPHGAEGTLTVDCSQQRSQHESRSTPSRRRPGAACVRGCAPA
jgi:hypothetical protein